MGLPPLPQWGSEGLRDSRSSMGRVGLGVKTNKSRGGPCSSALEYEGDQIVSGSKNPFQKPRSHSSKNLFDAISVSGVPYFATVENPTATDTANDSFGCIHRVVPRFLGHSLGFRVIPRFAKAKELPK